MVLRHNGLRDHPIKTSPFFRGGAAQREKSNIFLSLLTWTPPETPGVSKDAPLSTELGFGGLVL